MYLFSDTERQSKLFYLRSELEEWDRLSIGDQELARERLKWVLQQVSEGVVKEMDWTPNEVSLEEVGTEMRVSVGEKEMAFFVDEMDLD